MSKIEWTNVTWNPVTGCDKVSQGCKNCYAEIMHRRLRGMYPDKYSKPFLGHVQTHKDELSKPLKWKKPKMVFVNSMSDLFHEDVPFDFVDHVFAVMAVTPMHTYQILTKRPDRMHEYFRSKRHYFDCPNTETKDRVWNIALTNFGKYETIWPLKNVWLGTSCEDQKTAELRIPHLLQVPGVIRFLSCEPLLGAIDLSAMITKHFFGMLLGKLEISYGIQWVIVGGESGHKARPMHPDWVRSLRDQCKEAGIPFFFKQWGGWLPHMLISNNREMNDHWNDSLPKGEVQMINKDGKHNSRLLIEGVTEPLYRMIKVGKHKSGNTLDGEQHLNYPKL